VSISGYSKEYPNGSNQTQEFPTWQQQQQRQLCLTGGWWLLAYEVSDGGETVFLDLEAGDPGPGGPPPQHREEHHLSADSAIRQTVGGL
jgi:hypothetical protein